MDYFCPSCNYEFQGEIIAPLDKATCPSCGVRGRIAARFWSNVRKTGGCWFWGANASYRDGRPSHHYRIAYQLVKGAIPEGMSILHSCDNPQCVNPAHLSLGTQADNIRDAMQKGRFPQAGAHPRKLSFQKVSEIRTKYASGTTSTYELAKEYGVGQSIIWRTVRGLAWKESRDVSRAN